MLPEVAYADYQRFGGAMGEEEWQRALPHALEAVRRAMGFHEPNPEWAWQVEAYKRAVCAAADVDRDYGFMGPNRAGASGRGGFTIGSYSRSGSGTSSATGESSDYAADMAAAIRGALAKSGLLCRVIG